MIKFLPIIIFYSNLILLKTQFNYFSILETNLSLINGTYSTVVISESKDLGSCTCDLTPDSCDYLCCCDPECPTKITSIWISDPNNICLDKKNSENSYLTQCFNEDIIFYYNRKRGMKEFRDPMSNLFCVTFDNSSIMGKFYKDITTLQKTTIDAIYKNYVDTQIKNFYYYNQNIDALPSNTINYLVGDYIRAKIGTGLNDYTFDGKFFTYKTGAFGDCIKNLAVRFMIPIEKSTCGFKLKPFSSCSKFSWDQIISKNLSYAPYNDAFATFSKVKIGSVLLRDYDTGKLDLASNPSNVQPTKLSISTDGINCSCSNVLEAAEFNFIINQDSNIIMDILINVILVSSIKYQCNKNYIMSQTYSSIFLNSNSSAFIKSGSPGYIQGKRLLTAYNATDSNGIGQFRVPKEGTYVVGRKIDGTCAELDNNQFYVNSNLDSPIQYGVNSAYSCTKNFNLDQFKNFCNNKSWKQYSLYNFVNRIQYVGIFGSSNINYIKDWSQVIFDFDLNQSSWSSNNNTCTFPQSIFLDVLFSKAGATNNPQEYVVSARISAYYENVKFLSNDPNQSLQFAFRFITNYVSLNEDMLTATRASPSIIPNLPGDIANPLVENN